MHVLLRKHHGEASSGIAALCWRSAGGSVCGDWLFYIALLVHAGAAFVHACEWNPHAVVALRKNLDINGVAHRCQIHFGDNRKLKLSNIADRVNLGLIPSSEEGWPIACQLLRRDAGAFCISTKMWNLTQGRLSSLLEAVKWKRSILLILSKLSPTNGQMALPGILGEKCHQQPPNQSGRGGQSLQKLVLPPFSAGARETMEDPNPAHPTGEILCSPRGSHRVGFGMPPLCSTWLKKVDPETQGSASFKPQPKNAMLELEPIRGEGRQGGNNGEVFSEHLLDWPGQEEASNGTKEKD